MTTRRLRFVVGAALLVGVPACGDDDGPIGCNPCFDAQIDTGSLADGGVDADPDAAVSEPGGE